MKTPGLAAMVIKNGVDYDSLDGEPVTLLFLIAAPNTKDNVHLDVLSKLSVMLMDENFTTSLRNAKSVEEFLQIIDAADESAKSIDDRLSDTGITTEEKKSFKLLAVTSCPTGIAHTYMAAEALEKAAKAADCQYQDRDQRFRRCEKCTDCGRNRRSGLHHRSGRRKSSHGSL